MTMSREAEYLFQTSDGRYVYVDSAGTYATFRVFVGTPGKMEELKVAHVS